MDHHLLLQVVVAEEVSPINNLQDTPELKLGELEATTDNPWWPLQHRQAKNSKVKLILYIFAVIYLLEDNSNMGDISIIKLEKIFDLYRIIAFLVVVYEIRITYTYLS